MKRILVMVVVLTIVAAGCNKAYDFDNDNRADFVVVTPSGAWRDLAKPLTDPPLFGSGTAGEVFVPGDYDGNGSFDPAVVKANGDWVTASAGTISLPPPAQLDGFTGTWHYQMLPVPADYNGDNTTDLAWYRDSDGTWFIKGQPPVQFGKGPTFNCYGPGAGCSLRGNDVIDQDLPVPADYDGDGKADLATYNPRTLVWKVKSSRDGSISSVTMGGTNVVITLPAPGDYDGVHHAQRMLFGWEGWRLEGHPAPILFGQYVAGDPAGPGALSYPAAADYDGDGRTDLSYVSLAGSWKTRSSAAPATITTYSIGGLGATGASVAVAMRGASYMNIARLTLIGRNCTPGMINYPNDC